MTRPYPYGTNHTVREPSIWVCAGRHFVDFPQRVPYPHPMSSTLHGQASPPPAPPARPRRTPPARVKAPALEARGGPETQRRVREGAGLLSAAAMRRLDEDLEWYRQLPAEDRS